MKIFSYCTQAGRLHVVGRSGTLRPVCEVNVEVANLTARVRWGGLYATNLLHRRRNDISSMDFVVSYIGVRPYRAATWGGFVRRAETPYAIEIALSGQYFWYKSSSQ